MTTQRTHTPTLAQAMRLQLAIDAARAGKLKPGADVYGFGFNEAANAIAVHPINADPFVAIGAKDEKGNADFARFTVHTFESQRGSGTDKLRARIAADQFLASLGE